MRNCGPVLLDVKAESARLLEARQRFVEIARRGGWTEDTPPGSASTAQFAALIVQGAPDVIYATLDMARKAVDELVRVSRQYQPGAAEHLAAALVLDAICNAANGLVAPMERLWELYKLGQAGKPEAN